MDSSICSICINDINRNHSNLICKHKFHKGCINLWFKKSFLCPICRTQNDYYHLINKGIEYYNLYIILKYQTYILFCNQLTDYLSCHKQELIYVLNYTNIVEIIKKKYSISLIQLSIIYNINYLIFKYLCKFDNIYYVDLMNNSFLMIALKYNICNKKINYLLKNIDINIINIDNENALLIALKYRKNKQIIKYLLKKTHFIKCDFLLRLKINNYLFLYHNYYLLFYFKIIFQFIIKILKKFIYLIQIFYYFLIISYIIIYNFILMFLLFKYYNKF